MKRKLNMGRMLACTAGLALLAGSAAAAQEAGAHFTVLSNNTNAENTLLYVEFMYVKPGCRDVQATFRLKYTGAPADGVAVAVDSFLNNHGTYDTDPARLTLKRPAAAGYRLRFALPAGVTAAHNPQICVESHVMTTLCKGCAAGGSDAIFSTAPESIPADCPYTDAQGDLLACYRRTGAATGQWEAWVQDVRDCRIYRTVYMPDHRWWFAQNLSYRELDNHGDAGAGAPAGGYWCPGGASAAAGAPVAQGDNAQNSAAGTAGSASCSTYGALYTWATATSVNGRGATQDLAQGVCPAGWLLPTAQHFSALFAAVQNGGADTVTAQRLKSTVSCPPHAATDVACATAERPAWAWRRASYEGKVANPLALADDRYGFSALPAGMRRGDGAGFAALGYEAHWWTATATAAGAAANVMLGYAQRAPLLTSTPVGAGLSVRCTKP